MAITLYRDISCDNYDQINDQISRWLFQNQFHLSRKFWNPLDTKSFLSACDLFLSWTIMQKVASSSIAVTVAQNPDKCCLPHIDTPPARYKLSWPVLNYTDTYNCWYETTSNSTTSFTADLGGKMFIDRSHLKEIYRREVSTPAIIDAGVIHDVISGPQAKWPRLVLQCQLFKEPDHL